jgi:hypothetical protein
MDMRLRLYRHDLAFDQARRRGRRSIVERDPDKALTLAALPDFSMRLGAV